MRFLVDMGIGLDVVLWLRDEGHDVIHLVELNLQRLPDIEILNRAAQDNRILLTHDLDFSRLMALTGAEKPSIVSFRLQNMSPAAVILRVRSIIESLGSELERGAVVSVRDSRIRCLMLPIGSESSDE